MREWQTEEITKANGVYKGRKRTIDAKSIKELKAEESWRNGNSATDGY